MAKRPRRKAGAGTRLYGDWAKVGKTYATLSLKSTFALNEALSREAHRQARDMQDIIRTGSGPDGPLAPNSPITVYLKGSSKPLVHRSSLINSVKATKVGHLMWTAGVDRKKMHRSGRRMVDIAAVHEFGTGASIDAYAEQIVQALQPGGSGPSEAPIIIFQTVTDKQRRFFIHLKMAGLMEGVPKVGDKIQIRIPKRPFVTPVWRKAENGIEERIARDFFFIMKAVK